MKEISGWKKELLKQEILAKKRKHNGNDWISFEEQDVEEYIKIFIEKEILSPDKDYNEPSSIKKGKPRLKVVEDAGARTFVKQRKIKLPFSRLQNYDEAQTLSKKMLRQKPKGYYRMNTKGLAKNKDLNRSGKEKFPLVPFENYDESRSGVAMAIVTASRKDRLDIGERGKLRAHSIKLRNFNVKNFIRFLLESSSAIPDLDKAERTFFDVAKLLSFGYCVVEIIMKEIKIEVEFEDYLMLLALWSVSKYKKVTKQEGYKAAKLYAKKFAENKDLTEEEFGLRLDNLEKMHSIHISAFGDVIELTESIVAMDE